MTTTPSVELWKIGKQAESKPAASNPVAQKSTSTSTASAAPSSSGSSSASAPLYIIQNSDITNDYTNDGKDVSATEALDTCRNASVFDGKLEKDATCYRGRSVSGINCVADGKRSQINVYNEETGQYETKSGAQAMADSYDSELDLYIEATIADFIKNECGGDSSYWWEGRGFMTPEKQKLLKEKYNIVIAKLDDRTFSFSMVDDLGNIIEDTMGNKASIIWGDWVIPDGFAQGAELNLSSMLDLMGYECISKADFIGHDAEYQQLLSTVESEMNKLDAGQQTTYLRSSGIDAGEYITKLYQGSTTDVSAHGSSEGQVDQGGEGGDEIAQVGETPEEQAAREAEEKAKKEAEEKAKKEAAKKAAEADAQSGATGAGATASANVMDDALKEYLAYVEQAQKDGIEYDKDALIKDYAEKFGVDKDDLEYAVLKA